MAKRIEYHEGEQVGNHGITFLRDSDKYYISASGNKYRQAYFLCPYCQREFLSPIQDVKSGKRRCGCMTSKQKAKGGSSTGVDISNKQFGRLTPLYYKIVRSSKGKSKRLWYCQCECGGHTWTTVDSLVSGHTLSCGCLKIEKVKNIHTKDIKGMTSGMLTAQYNTGRQDNRGNYYWYCTCKCGGHKEVIASHIIGNQVISCGCLVSKGENKIRNLLNELNIFYETQKTFDECVNPATGAKLKFDFYIPDLKICIEYDGKQHFSESDTWAEKEGLGAIQFRDDTKNRFCQTNGIQLIRIPYWDYALLNKNYLSKKIQWKGEE